MPTEAKAFKKLFPQKHVVPILDALYQAGTTLRKKTETEREDPITRRLYKQLIRISPFRNGPLDIYLQPEILSQDPDSEDIGGRIDILISCGKGAEVYFAIEAKRLRFKRPNGDFEAGYSAFINDGMMRFLTGQYAPFMRSGAMLGYVFDCKVAEARSGIDKAMQTKIEELKFKSPHNKLIGSSISTRNSVDETQHDLDERVFIIYHVLLPV